MSKSPRTDVYGRISSLVSLDEIPEEILSELLEKPIYDDELAKHREALKFAVQFISDRELQLLFFRFFEGHSYKTLKKSTNTGSTKTTAKRIRRMMDAIKEYIYYYLENDYERDIKIVRESLGDDAAAVSDLLFKRYSKNKIHKSKKIKISNVRLRQTITDIEILCLQRITLSGFWEVIQSVGKLPEKNS